MNPTPTPTLTHPAADLSDLVLGPLELGWLRPTGRVPDVLRAWGHGALGEAPTGLAWDVVRLPTGVAYETVRRLGIPGVAAPVAEATGEWAVYDRSAAPRRDITARAKAAVRERLGARQGLPWSDVPPARGFVFPHLGRRP